jgi:predicted GNAT superfamily acetyltransferase
MSLSYRRASAPDYPGILRLQSANYLPNVAPKDRSDGFLSAEFSAEQMAAIAEDLGIVIAAESGKVAGYLCAFRNEFDHGSPVLAEMLGRYDRVQFNGRSLSSYRSYIYGPVCIAREYRGRGILRRLYDAQKNDLTGGFDAGVAFVSRANPHSLQAHVSGLGMVHAADFEVNGNVYAMLAFSL